MTHDESLWDPSAPQDDDVRRLQASLGKHRYAPRPFELPADEPTPDPGTDTDTDTDTGAVTAPGPFWAARAGRRRAGHLLQLAAAAAILLVLFGEVFDWAGWVGGGGGGAPGADYELELAEGSLRVEGSGDALARAGRSLSTGDRLVLEDDARARVSLGPQGWFALGPRSRLRFEAAGGQDDEAHWRLFLERGELSASIFAAPRLFQLGTPSGIAVDLGCIYTAQVDDDGWTRLMVSGGQVSFETEQRQVVVPAGAQVVARPGRGPGTPTWEDGPVELAQAVDQLDEAGAILTNSASSALATVLAVDQPRDSLTLWHLLDHPLPEVRRAVHERLATLAPPPRGVTAAGVLAGDPAMLEAWRYALELDW